MSDSGEEETKRGQGEGDGMAEAFEAFGKLQGISSIYASDLALGAIKPLVEMLGDPSKRSPLMEEAIRAVAARGTMEGKACAMALEAVRDVKPSRQEMEKKDLQAYLQRVVELQRQDTTMKSLIAPVEGRLGLGITDGEVLEEDVVKGTGEMPGFTRAMAKVVTKVTVVLSAAMRGLDKAVTEAVLTSAVKIVGAGAAEMLAQGADEEMAKSEGMRTRVAIILEIGTMERRKTDEEIAEIVYDTAREAAKGVGTNMEIFNRVSEKLDKVRRTGKDTGSLEAVVVDILLGRMTPTEIEGARRSAGGEQMNLLWVRSAMELDRRPIPLGDLTERGGKDRVTPTDHRTTGGRGGRGGQQGGEQWRGDGDGHEQRNAWSARETRSSQRDGRSQMEGQSSYGYGTGKQEEEQRSQGRRPPCYDHLNNEQGCRHGAQCKFSHRKEDLESHIESGKTMQCKKGKCGWYQAVMVGGTERVKCIACDADF